MTQKIVAIDLGTYSLKALLIERRYEDFSILEFVEIPLNHQARLSHEEQLALALEQLLSDAKWQSADALTTSLPGALMSSRVLQLPFSNAKRIQSVLDFELENHIPLSIEETFSDFHVLSSTDDVFEVLSVYLPENKVAKYMEIFTHKLLDPKYLGADLVDLSNLAQVSMLPKDCFYVLCDIGHNKTNICIMEGTKLRYVRTLGVAGAHFTRAIQRAYNLNYEKAEALKISRGRIYVREDESDQISRILTNVALELITLIKQTVFAFQSQAGQIPIFAFYCCGGSAQLVGLLDYLSFHLKSNVVELNPLSMVSHSFKDPDEIGLRLAPTLSIALRPIYSNRLPRINFRKGHFAFKQDIQAITSELKSVVVFMILVVLAGIGYYFYTDSYYQKRSDVLDNQVKQWVQGAEFELEVGSSRRGDSNAGPIIKRYIRAANNKLQELQKQMSEFSGQAMLTPLQVMQEMTTLLPPKQQVNLQISEFNFSEDFVKLVAETDDPLNVPTIVAALQKSTAFESVEADDAKAKPGNIWDFTVRITLKKFDAEADDEATSRETVAGQGFGR